MIDAASQFWNFLWGLAQRVFNIYLLGGIFGIPIALWILSKIVKFFRRVLP